MPTSLQIANKILRGQLFQANLSKGYAQQEKVGNFFSNWDYSVFISTLVQGLQFQLSISDFNSATTLNIYNKLSGELGAKYIVGAALDPNAQLPNTTVINNNGFVGTNVVRGIILFTNVNPVQLLNYNTTYKQLYGNNLITLDIFLTGYTEDEQTPPTILYAISNDPTSDIVSITWAYPIPVSGYIQIAGVVPISGTPATGGGGSVPFTFTNANLLPDGNGGFYLPMMLPIGKRPSYTESNNVEIKANYDNNYSPGRLYGFANNLTQTITVLVI